MRKQTKRLLSVFIICCMMMIGLGMSLSALATNGTNDASLSSLEISPGTLSPEFSSDVYEYKVEVGSDCDKLLVSAQTTDSGAKMVIAGNSGLKMGTNTVIINVTAADGVTTSKYSIQVTRGASESQTGESSSESQGTVNQPASSPLISGSSSLPGSLSNNDTESQSTDSASSGTITTPGKTITLSEPNESIVPEGFNAIDLTVNGQTVKAWKFPSSFEVEGFYLIYGTDEAGKTAFYLYDESTGSVITAPDGVLTAGQDNLISQNQITALRESYQKSMKNRMMIIIGLSALCIILLIAFTAAMTRKKHHRDEEDYSDYDEDYPDSGYDDGYEEDSYEENSYEEDSYEEDAYEEDSYDEESLDYEEKSDAESYENGSFEGEDEETEALKGGIQVDELFDLDLDETAPEVQDQENEDTDPSWKEELIPEEEIVPEEEIIPEEEVIPEEEIVPEEMIPERKTISEEIHAEAAEEEDDLDADFDLLEALLSDSVRSMRPDDADSIVKRAAEKAGRRPPKAAAPVKETKQAKLVSTVGRPEPAEKKTETLPKRAETSGENLEDDDDFEFFDL